MELFTDRHRPKICGDLSCFDRRRHYGHYSWHLLCWGDDLQLFLALVRGKFTISGFQNVTIRMQLSEITPHQVSCFIKRLRKHGLIRKTRNTYKYYPTTLGRRVILTALKLKEMFIIPYLRGALTT